MKALQTTMADAIALL